jgi:peptidoglycan hydrolase-like protein with peptidoglycan-binding domain
MALFDEVFGPYVPFGSRVLRLTDPPLRGTDVAVLQAVYDVMLAAMQPPEGPMGPLIAIGGVYDRVTARAVRDVQAYFGLRPDGVAGPETYFVFGQGVARHVTYGGPRYGSRQLQSGAFGGDVTVLQNRLNTFRYASTLGHPADGSFGAATAAAVLAFKADAAANGDTGFPSNGIVGFGFYDASWIYTFAGGRGLFTGRNGFDVAFVQVLLKNLGFYHGAVTGYYDAATRAAVAAFQTASGIAADGVVGQQTFYQLGLKNAVPAPEPLGVAWPIPVILSPEPSLTVNGHAILYFQADQTLTVALNASGLTPATAYQANVHFGSCTAGGPVGYPLPAFTPGASGTISLTATLSGIGVVPPSGWFLTIELPATTPGGTPTVVACGDVTPAFPFLAPSTPVSFSPVAVTLTGVNGSSASGSATLRFTAPQTLLVTVSLTGLPPSSTHPAHIHYGTCAALPAGPIAYPLQDLVADASGNATATTTVPGVQVIPPAGWFINVHQGPSLEGAGATPIACGNVSPSAPVLPLVGV